MQDDDTKPPIPPTAPAKTAEPEANEMSEGEIPQPTNADFIRQIIAKIAASENILVALSRNPSVDEIASAVGLALFLEETGKHVTAIYSGETPNILEFLKPEETFEDNTDSLQDFIIALNKEKADHLRYKVDGDYVKVFITPYKVKIDQDDLEFSHGDYNVDLVIALNVPTASDLDAALSEHGRIMHDASAIDITTGEPGRFGEIEWSDPEASSVGEMVADLLVAIKKPEIQPEIATALLAAMMAATNRFADENTKPTTMTMAAKLMELGADQHLVAMNVMENSAPELIGAVDMEEAPSKKKVKDDKTLLTVDHENGELEDAIKEAVASVEGPEKAEEKTTPDEIKSGAVAKAPVAETTEPVEPVEPVEAPAETPVETSTEPAEMPVETVEVAPVESNAAMPEVVEPAEATGSVATEPTPAESVEPAEPAIESTESASASAESVIAPEEPKPEIETPVSATPDYSQMMSEALAESIPGDAPETPMPITSGPINDANNNENTDGEPEMASEPAALQDDSYVLNQEPKVISPIDSENAGSEQPVEVSAPMETEMPAVEVSTEALPDLPPPPIPPVDFGAIPPSDEPVPPTPETMAMPPVGASATSATSAEPAVTAPAGGEALEQLQQMAAPAQTVEAPTLPPVESVPGAIPDVTAPVSEPVTELTPDIPPQPMGEPEPAAPDAFQIPNMS